MKIIKNLFGQRKEVEKESSFNVLPLDLGHSTVRKHLPASALVEDIASGRLTDPTVIQARYKGLYPDLPADQITKEATLLTQLIREHTA